MLLFFIMYLASWKLCFSPKQTPEILGFFQRPLAAHLKHLFLSEAYPQLHIYPLRFQDKSNLKSLASAYKSTSSIFPRDQEYCFILLWKWYGVYIFLLRYEWHLMTGCVKIKPIGIFRCWKNGSFGKTDSRIFSASLPNLVSALAPALSFEYPPASLAFRLFCVLIRLT